MLTLARRVQEVAEQDPSRTALRWAGERVSYGSLVARAEEIRAALAAPAGPVAVAARKSPATVAHILACLMDGRPVLLAPPDLGADAVAQVVREAAAADADDEVTAASVPFLFTTSGTTGVPRVVPLPADAVDRFADWASTTFGIGPASRVLSHAPLHFDLSLLDVWTTLRAGGEVVLVEHDQAGRGRPLAELLAAARVTVVQGVPLLYGLLLEVDGARFPSVERVIFTGDALPPRTLARLPALFPAARLYNVYGCTETNDSFLFEVDRGRLPEGPVPIGSPLPGVSALVIGDGDVIEGPGSGELYVSTPFQTAGYLGERRQAGGRFVDRPDGRRYFRSGDMVRRDADGQFALLGRSDFHVKVRGVRVSLQEVEAVIAGHEQVAEAAVVAVPAGDAGHRLVAFVRADRRLSTLELRTRCARTLPRAAIPAQFLVSEAPLPRGATGKVDRRALAASLAGDGTAETIGRFILAEFLAGERVEELDGDFDILASGVVDSLGMLRLATWLEGRFGVAIDEAQVVEDNFRTVNSVAGLVRRALEAGPAPSPKPAARVEDLLEP